MDPPHPTPPEQALAEALEEYHRRLAAGLPVRPADFAAALGPAFADFQAVLRAEAALDGAKAAAPAAVLGPFGKYTLLRELGKGGVGVVYEAVERPLGRVVALKKLADSRDSLPEARARFRDEATLTAQVRHDHIVAIHDSGDVDGQLYFTMDLVPGRSLGQLIEAGEVPEPRALAREIAGVADALAALHARGIVHRDIKPSNVMVRPDGRMILADFGLARIQGGMRLTKTGHVSATGHHASPEQLRARKEGVDARSDVYNVGSTLYTALVGAPPFRTEDWNELYRLKLHDRAPAPRELGVHVPSDLEGIVLKCLEPEPADRYQTAADLAEQLRRFAAGDAVTDLGPVPRWLRAGRWVGRRWKPLAAAAALGAGFAVWRAHRPARIVFDDEGFPVAGAVAVDGRPAGTTPLEVELAAGSYQVEVRRADFASVRRPYRLGAGQVERFPLLLVPETAAASEVVGAFVRRMAGAPALDDGSGTRATDLGGDVTLLAPVGRVRPADLALGWAVDLDLEALPACLPADVGAGEPSPCGALVLRRGAQELWRAPLRAETESLDAHLVGGAFPAQALARVKAGDRLEFAWEPSAGSDLAPVRARIDVLADDPAGPALERVARFLGHPEDSLTAQIRAEVLLKHDLVTAAWFEASRAAMADPGRRDPWRVLVKLLERTGPGAPLLHDVDNYLFTPGTEVPDLTPAPLR